MIPAEALRGDEVDCGAPVDELLGDIRAGVLLAFGSTVIEHFGAEDVLAFGGLREFRGFFGALPRARPRPVESLEFFDVGQVDAHRGSLH